jgi:Ni/Co efflux regulator RcnB
MTEPPATPTGLPPDLVSALDGCTPAQLRDIAGYASDLATHKERAADEETDSDGEEEDATETAPDPPSDVPARATLTTKEINGHRYHYWQWRDGDTIRSKYRGPAGAESE